MSKKLFLFILVFICFIAVPTFALGDKNSTNNISSGLVPCDGTLSSPCGWKQVVGMLNGIYSFIVDKIAVPLAILALVVGGIILMASAGDPKAAGLGKTIIWSAIIGLLLALCSKLIINFILNAIGAGAYSV